MDRTGLSLIMNGNRTMTPGKALKIEKTVGYLASALLHIQSAFDLAIARHDPTLHEEVEDIDPILMMA